MKADIEKQFPEAEIQLIEGSNGIFDVKKDGKLIFSKSEQHRFPQPDEILAKL